MGFRETIDRESIDELPLRDAIVVHSGTVLRGALALMRSHALGCCVIVDYVFGSAGIPCGIFTEQSLLDALTKGASLDDRAVCDFADSKFLAVNRHEPISRVWDAVLMDGLRFVCVTGDDGKVIGITGQRGIAEYISEHFSRQVSVQRLGGTPWMQQREGA